MSENVGILKRYLIKGSRGNICCSSSLLSIAPRRQRQRQQQTARGQSCMSSRKENNNASRRCTKSQAGNRISDRSSQSKFRGVGAQQTCCMSCRGKFPPPHGWRKEKGTGRGQPANQQDGMSMLFQQRK